MASQIMQYVDQAFHEAIYNRKGKPFVPPKAPHRSNGDFRNGNQIFLGLHPNKSIFEKPMASLHNHSYVELVYVYRGCFYQRIGNEAIRCQEGSISLLNPNTLHQPWVETDKDIVLNIGIQSETVQKAFSLISGGIETAIDGLSEICFAKHPGNKNNFLYIPNAKKSESLISDMFGEYFERNTRYEQTIVADFMHLLIGLSMHSQEKSESVINLDDIIAYIDSHFTELNMEQLSQHFNYSQRQMRRILRSFSDDSLPVLLNRRKIQKACEYIDRYQMATDEILENIGFQNAHHFYDTFKSITGICLSDYRENAGMLSLQ